MEYEILYKNKHKLFDLTTKDMLFNSKGLIIKILNLFRFTNFFFFE